MTQSHAVCEIRRTQRTATSGSPWQGGMISRPKAVQKNMMHAVVARLTLFPVQQSFVDCICSFRLLKVLQAFVGILSHKACGFRESSFDDARLRCAPRCYALHQQKLRHKRSNEFLIKQTYPEEDQLPPDTATACSPFAKWCGCQTKSSSPRPLGRRISFSFFLSSSADVPNGKRKIFVVRTDCSSGSLSIVASTTCFHRWCSAPKTCCNFALSNQKGCRQRSRCESQL